MKTQSIRRIPTTLVLIAFLAIALAVPAGAENPTLQSPVSASVLPGESLGLGASPLERALGADETLGIEESPEAPKKTVIPGRYIVVLKDSIKRPGAVADDQAEEVDGEVSLVYRSALKGYSATLPKDEVEALEEDPRVKYVTPDRRVEVAAQAIPIGIERIDATSNESLDIDGKENVQVDADVAVLDTGIDYEHPDLNVVARTNCVPAGENWATEYEHEECVDDSGTDGYGHGTHVAGTVGALDNGEGVVGVAPDARLWAVRVFTSQGNSAQSWIIAGVDWVTAHATEIEVANMSLGCECSMPALEEAIEASTEAGVVYTIAAGNNAKDAKSFSPAKNPDAITVSALNLSDHNTDGKKPYACVSSKKDDVLAGFSNFGEDVDVVAPGTCVYSTLPDGEYRYMNGTSMAAPHVAGAAAILASEENPEDLEDVEAIREAIEEEGSSAWEDTSGDGVKEPLLDIGNESTFAAKAQPITQPATIVSESKATLHGLVNPEGLSTTYHFEYGTSTAYGSSAPASPKSIGSGAEYVSVEEPLEGLKGQTLYHYRVVATNSKGTFYGPDRPFGTTPPVASIETPTVHANDATLKASVNPEGLETTYQFEYGTTSSYGFTVPAPSQSVGSGAGNVKVSELITSLTGSKTYHYRLRVTNAAGAVFTGDQTFTTQPSEWKVEASESGKEHVLYAVSCSSQSDCMAVGIQRALNGLLSEHWDGEKWSVVSMPEPAEKASVATLESVSCVSANWCVAAGWYQHKSGDLILFVEHWDGEEWSISSFPSVKVSNVYMPDVSCVSSSACVVVGVEYDASPQAIAVTWDGKEWSQQSVPEPEVTGVVGSALASVSCTSAISCVAVGQYNTATESFPLTEYWDGSQWSVIQDSNLSEPSFFGLQDVDCVTPEECVAIVHGGNEVERWDGESWTPESVPEPIGADLTFNLNLDISCPTSTSCTMAGMYRRFAGSYWLSDQFWKPRITAWNGTGWTLQSVADPSQEQEPNTSLAPLHGISCTSPSSCVTVGTFAAKNEFNALIERYQAPGPVSATDPATEVASDSATLNATVDPEGSATSYYFEYGPTASYGAKVPTSAEEIGSGSEEVEVSETPEGLAPDTTYHFRVVASNAEGTTFGEDRTFRTVDVPHFASSFGDDGAEEGQLSTPFGIAIDADDNVWLADTGNDRIEKFNPKGELLLQFGSSGTGAGQFDQPYALAVDSEGDIWVADSWNNRIQKFNSKGEFQKAIGWGVDDGTSKEFQTCTSSCFAGISGSGSGQLYRPYGLSFDSKGDLWVADTWNVRIQKFNSKGEYQSKFSMFRPAADVVVDEAGDLWVVQYNYDRVTKFSPAGEELMHFGGSTGDGKGEFDVPSGLGIDSEGNIWVADSENDRIQGFSPEGQYLTQFGESGEGDGELSFPRDLASDSEGDFWVADSYGSRVQRWTYADPPKATTEAASGIQATQATLNATVNPEGRTTSYYFEYGKTTSYGTKIPVSPKSIGSGTSNVEVSQTPTGLAKGTTYHYRVVAESAAGTTNGEDKTLTTASKAVWLNEGEPLEGKAEIAFSGDMKFEVFGAGVECGVDASLAITGSDSAEIKAFDVATSSCEGFGSAFEGCAVSEAKVPGLPWDVEVGAEELTLEGVSVEYAFEECSFEEVESMSFGPAEITAELEEPEQISSVSLFGEAPALLLMGEEELELEVNVEGALEVLENAQFSGDMKFEVFGAGVECGVDASLAITGSDSAEIKAFDVATSSCEGFGSAFEGCAVSEAKVPGLPWDVEVGAEELTLEGVSVEYAFEECSFEEVEGMSFGPAEITAELEEPEQISSVSLFGEAPALLLMGEEELELEVNVEGALDLIGLSKPGQYGVG